jgi:hypothetical protein
MVMGAKPGLDFARAAGLSALILTRSAEGIHAEGTGLFAA